jgi:tetrahydromethanopterin S-methyltransferase subunit B
VDWLNKNIHNQRAVVKQIVDELNSTHSARAMGCADELLKMLQPWKLTTESFPGRTGSLLHLLSWDGSQAVYCHANW